jgi:hypothetical protein
MDALEMVKLSIVFLVSVIFQGVASDFCTYTPYLTQYTEYCAWGCCYTTIYPCCDEPLYANPAFIVPIVVCSVGVFIAVVVVLIIIIVRRRRAASRTHFGTVLANGQVVTTANQGANMQAAYYNPQYPNAPMFATQQPNGGMPMYSVQTPQGTVPMYQGQQGAINMYQPQGQQEAMSIYTTQGQQGGPPMYTSQAPQDAPPTYATQAPYGAASTQAAHASSGDNHANEGLPPKQQ